MDVRIKLAKLGAIPATSHEVKMALNVGTLGQLFATLAKRHPELAPILEDATHAEDLEIRLNNAPLPPSAEELRLHDGDEVSLLVKVP